MNRLKVTLFSDTIYDVNGVSRFLTDFAVQSKDKEFDVVSSSSKEANIECCNIHNIKPFFKMKMPFYDELDLVFPNPFKIANKLKTISPNLIHISTPGPVGLIASFLAKKYKIPKVGIYHTDFPEYLFKNTDSPAVKYISKLYLKQFYKKFDAIFVRSCEYKEIIIKDLKFPREKIYTLRAGIDRKKFSPEFMDINIWDKYKIRIDSFKFLYVGRVTKEKNIEFLFEIFKDIRKLNLNIDLIIVGSGDYLKQKDELEKYNIHLLGKKFDTELSAIYATCDVFIFPSTTDTLGQVILEAMSSALPIIVTNAGGPKEFVKKADSGFVLNINDKSFWHKAIVKLYNDKQIYAKFKRNSIKFMENMDIEDSFKDFWNKNQEVLDKIASKSVLKNPALISKSNKYLI